MKNSLVVIVLAVIVVLGFVFFWATPGTERPGEYTLEQSREVAEEWMRTEAPTYVFDGSGLTLMDRRELSDTSFEFVFGFESSAAGYGNREDQMLAQVITPHRTVVVVEEGAVVDAVTDGVFSEIDGTMIDEEPAETVTLSLYFVSVTDGTEEVVAVEREFDRTVTPARAALEALFSGPTEAEAAVGYTSAIPSGVVIRELSIEDGVATVDLSSELDAGVAGSATVMAIREQIESTLLQFETVNDVIISVEGEVEGILQP